MCIVFSLEMDIENFNTSTIILSILILFLFIILICFIFFDVDYFLHIISIWIWGQFQSNKKRIDDTLNYYGVCMTNDIDGHFTHMNNVKYLKHLDFARFDFVHRTGLFEILVKTQSKFYQVATNIRYRRPITIFKLYKITTKMIYYDEKSIYFQQDIITVYDNFIRATALSKQSIIGLDVSKTINQLLNQDEHYRYELIPELIDWIKLIEKSSKNLRNRINTG